MSLKLVAKFDPEIYSFRAEYRYPDPLCCHKRSQLRHEFDKALHIIGVKNYYLLESPNTLTAYFMCDLERHMFSMALIAEQPQTMVFKPEEYPVTEYPKFITDFQNKIKGTSLDGRIALSLSDDGSYMMIQTLTA